MLGDAETRPGLRDWGGVQTVAEAEGRAGEAADKDSAAGPKPPLPLQPLGAAPGFGTGRQVSPRLQGLIFPRWGCLGSQIRSARCGPRPLCTASLVVTYAGQRIQASGKTR